VQIYPDAQQNTWTDWKTR